MDSELLLSIHQQNPWLQSQESLVSLISSEFIDYIDRLQSEFLEKEDWDSLWSILIGPRQSGKTTLGKYLCNQLITKKRYTQLLYLNCDYSSIRQWLSSATFLSEAQEVFGLKNFILFIDEVQRLESPGLLLKIIADLKLPIKMIASGSSGLEIKSKVSEHLTGRQLTTLIYPLSCTEIPFDKCYEQILLYGSYPQVYLAKEKNTFLQELFNNYIQKDIIEFLKVGKPDVILKLIGLLAHGSGQLLNFQQLAVDCNVNVETIRNYISILEQTFVVQLIRPFVGNKRTELTSNPICYFIDNGFRNKSIENFLDLKSRSDVGLLVENMVFQELVKFKAQGRKEWAINYWRTKGGAEVDFVLKDGVDRIIPIEVKYRKMTKLSISRGYRSFIEVYKPQKGFMVTKDQIGKVEVGTTTIHFIPLNMLPSLFDYL
jgi:uncharacterized protein